MSVIPIVVPILLVVLMGASWFKFHREEGRCPEGDAAALPFGILGMLFLFSLIAFTTAWGSLRCESIDTIAEMESFQAATVSAYATTYEETENAEIYVSSQALFDAGYFEQGQAASQRLAEFRDRVEQHNEDLAKLRRYNSMWLTDGLFADVPDDLRYIEIGE